MADTVKLRGDWHAETLSSGRTVAPGEVFERSLLDTDDPIDARLVDEGLIIDAVVSPVELEGEALQARAAELRIPKRSTMSADELRQAVAEREAAQTQPDPAATLTAATATGSAGVSGGER